MKTLHVATIAISLSVITGMVIFHSAYAQDSEFQNYVGLTAEQCQTKLFYEKDKAADSIDKIKAVKLAISSPDFQSKISGHRYALVRISTNETWDTSLCSNVKVTAIGIGFNLLDTATRFKSIQVTENPTISQVIKVNVVSSPICILYCDGGKPISKDFEPDLRFKSFITGRMTPNSTVPLEFDFSNNGNYTLHDVIILYFDFLLVSDLHLPSEIISLNTSEHKTITGKIRTPSELLDVPILVTGVVSAKDKDDRIGIKDFQQIINLANMSSYERTSGTIQIDSPFKQFKSGINAVDVKCKPDFLLVIKSVDNHPACTTPLTALRLLEFGWGHIVSPFETKVDLLHSKISGGQIIGFHYDLQAKSILVKIQTSSDGSLAVTIPRQLLDAKMNGHNDNLYVLSNGKQTDFNETHTTNTTRTLTIPFKMETLEIEILANTVGQQVS